MTQSFYECVPAFSLLEITVSTSGRNDGVLSVLPVILMQTVHSPGLHLYVFRNTPVYQGSVICFFKKKKKKTSCAFTLRKFITNNSNKAEKISWKLEKPIQTNPL